MKSYKIIHKFLRYLIPIFFIICFFSFGCSNQLIPGEQVEFHCEVEIFLASGEDEFYPINEEMVELLLNHVLWLNDSGTIFIEKAVTIEADEVKWSDGISEYSCEGAVIDASGVIQIKDDCPKSRQSISLELSYLPYLSELTGTVPKIASYPPETLFQHKFVPIKTFFVFSTSEERGNTRWTAAGVVLGILAAVAIIWFVFWFIIRFIKRRFFKVYD